MSIRKTLQLLNLQAFLIGGLIILFQFLGFSQTGPDSLLTALKTATGKQKFLVLKQLGKFYQQKDPQKSFEYAVNEKNSAIELKDKSREAEALNDISIPLMMLQKNKNAILILQECIKIYDSLGDESGKAMAVNNMGIAWSQMGATEKALGCYLSVLPYFTKKNANTNLALAYMNIGLLYHKINKYDKALEAELKAKDLFIKENNSHKIASVNVNLGIISHSLSKFDEAQKLFEDALDYYILTGNIYSQALTMTNLAQMFKKKGELNKALIWYDKALPLIRSLKNNWAEASQFYDRAQISMQQGKWNEALQKLEFANEFNKNSEDQELQSQIYHSFYKVYDTLHQDKLALQNYKNYEFLKDSLVSLEKSRMIEELSLEYETAQKEIENEHLKQDIQASKTRFWALIGFSIAGFLISAFLIILQIQKRKNVILMKDQAVTEKQLHEIELEKAKTEKLLHLEELEKMQIDMQLKEQNLVYQTLLRLDITNVNRSVQEKLLPFHYKLTNKKDQNEFLQILNDITRDANKDPMADFEVMFTQLHKSFNENLLQRCPTLTKSELQVCALLHTNLSTKDIARLMSISPSSVDMTRHRIRQKLELDPKESLTTFLMTL